MRAHTYFFPVITILMKELYNSDHLLCPSFREALAHESLLNMPHRVDWRNCKESKEDETRDATAFREMFEKYDFNLWKYNQHHRKLKSVEHNRLCDKIVDDTGKYNMFTLFSFYFQTSSDFTVNCVEALSYTDNFNAHYIF